MQITKILATKKLEKKKLVCAYARVSSDKDAMLHSLSAQVQYYKDYITSNNDWLFVKVYYDEGISGTKQDRPAFQQMLQDAKDGKIDLIITKSISRFARNTVTLLEAVRKLKKYDVDVYFEEQRIHSISSDGELMLTILASYAQEEARSVSENMKWRVKRNFEEGKPWGRAPYGYTIENSKFVIVPKEAEAVKLIFKLYLDGIGSYRIKDIMNKSEYPTRNNCLWTETTIRGMLKNYIYTGNAVFQTTYVKNYITKKKAKNNGEKPMYHVEECHDAIISIEDYNKVQKIIKERTEKIHKGITPKDNPFKGKLICAHCGCTFRMKKNYKKYVWRCGTYIRLGSKKCLSKQIPNDALQILAKEILGVDELTSEIIDERIEKVIVGDDRLLTFYLKDGNKIDANWMQKSRSESWTEEMKENARRKAVERNGKSNSNPIND